MAEVLVKKRDNAMIFETLDLLERVCKVYLPDLNVLEDVPKAITELREAVNKNEVVNASNQLEEDLRQYFVNLEYNNFAKLLCKVLYTNENNQEITKEFVANFCNTYFDTDFTEDNIVDYKLVVPLIVELLSFNTLSKLFVTELKAIKFRHLPEDRRLLLLYYNKYHVMNFGFTALGNVCRGKVIDLETKEVVSGGYDKFFNLNETEETAIDNVQKALEKATSVYLSDKKDGTNMMVTKTEKFGLIMHTNGESNNKFTKLAKKLMDEKYPNIEPNLKPKHTYMFELVSPMTRVLIDYGKEETLTLTGIKDLTTNRLLSRAEMEEFANATGVGIIEEEEFHGIDELLDRHKSTSAKKEGWVCRITFEDNSETKEIMFKLKTEDYMKLLKVTHDDNYSNIVRVFEMVKDGSADDFYASLDETQQARFRKTWDRVLDCQAKLEEYIIRTGQEIVEKYKINMHKIDVLKGRAQDDNLTKKDCVMEMKNLQQACKEYPLGNHLLNHLQNGFRDPEEIVANMLVPGFKEALEFFDL